MNENLTKHEVYNQLKAVDVSKYVEKKGRYDYLSWTTVFGYMSSKYDFSYYAKTTNLNGEETALFRAGNGGMVATITSVNGMEGSPIWLPILDNKKMSIPYEKITASDVNNSLMRCYVKNVAMNWGFGISLWQDESLDFDAKPYASNKDVVNVVTGEVTSKPTNSELHYAPFITEALKQTVKNLNGSLIELANCNNVDDVKTYIQALKDNPSKAQPTATITNGEEVISEKQRFRLSQWVDAGKIVEAQIPPTKKLASQLISLLEQRYPLASA